jgi:hypothetical protein
MASFVVLTPPDGDHSDEQAVFIRDGFSLLALIVPVIWLLWHRLWFAAALLLLVSVGLAAAFDTLPQWSLVFAAASLALSWFVALEGNAMRITKKERQDWQLREIIEAQNAATAEEIYFSSVRSTGSAASSANNGKKTVLKPSRHVVADSGGPALGLMDFQGKY